MLAEERLPAPVVPLPGALDTPVKNHFACCLEELLANVQMLRERRRTDMDDLVEGPSANVLAFAILAGLSPKAAARARKTLSALDRNYPNSPGVLHSLKLTRLLFGPEAR